jgi:hypothetical protein
MQVFRMAELTRAGHVWFPLFEVKKLRSSARSELGKKPCGEATCGTLLPSVTTFAITTRAGAFRFSPFGTAGRNQHARNDSNEPHDRKSNFTVCCSVACNFDDGRSGRCATYNGNDAKGDDAGNHASNHASDDAGRHGGNHAGNHASDDAGRHGDDAGHASRRRSNPG